MKRFIVRFRRTALARDVVARLNASSSIRVIEETARMVLVEGSEADLRRTVGESLDIVIVPEQHYGRPNPPLKIEKS